MASKTTAAIIRRYLRNLEPGTVFTPAQLIQERLGTEDAVRQVLHRLALDGTIRRIAKGYYDVPRVSSRIGLLSPTPEAIITAYAQKTGGIIDRPKLDAANKLGLTTQVTARPVYRTNLSSRKLNIGGQRISLRTASPRSLPRDRDPAELVIDALAASGKRGISSGELARLRDFVQRNNLARKLKIRSKRVPTWMVPYIDTILDRG